MAVLSLAPYRADVALHVLVFNGVKNAEDIGALVRKPDAAFGALDASMVIDPFHLLAAALVAQHAHDTGKLATASRHSELVYAIGGTRQINKCLRAFGVKDNSSRVVLVTYEEAWVDKLRATVQGEEVPATSLQPGCDTAAIRKWYGVSDDELAASSLLDAAVNRIAVNRL